MASPLQVPPHDRRRSLLTALALAVVAIAFLALIATGVPFPHSGVDEPSPPDSTPPQQPATEPIEIPGFDIPYDLFRNLVLVVVALLCIAAVVYVTRRLSTDATQSTAAHDATPNESRDGTTVQAVADTAGETAQRLRDNPTTTFENEVYRAWREMTAALTVHNRDAMTPNDFAAQAIHAGMDENDVAELTHLFETVRYGGEAPTDATERRAIELLERIHTSYAGDNP